MDYAVFHGDLERVRELIDSDVNVVDGCNSSRDAPVIVAARYRHREIFDLLILCGAEVNCRAGYDGWTPLHWASYNGWVDQVRLLLEKGANLNAAANDGDTALVIASRIEGHREVFNLLLQYVVEVNCVSVMDKYGRTPLHWACFSGWVDQVRLILEKGADPNTAAKDGETLLHLASRKGWMDLVRLILEKGADPNAGANDGETPLISAASNSHREVFDFLIQYGAEVNCGGGYDNWTPLHWACFRGWVDEVRLILEKRADPNAAGKYDGDLPLEVTAREGHKDIFVLLFQYGGTMEFDCARISKHSFLEVVFTDVDLCTQAIVNKLHYHSLPTLYRNPDIAKMLPAMKNFKLKYQQKQQIAKYVEFEVETKKLCNVFNSQPIVLMLLCVQSLLSHHS